jgi:hypothetical protein
MNSQHAFPRYPNLVQDLLVIRPDQVCVCGYYVRCFAALVRLPDGEIRTSSRALSEAGS